MPTLPTLSLALLAYALGCINTGYLLVRWKLGRDLRRVGSGNAGATNVGRVLGPWGFGITLLADALKGALAVHFAQRLGLPAPPQVLIIVAVVVGHNWPAPLAFRGGKGVATSCGALLFFDPFLTLPLLGLLAVLLAVTRRPTVAAMTAYTLVPVVAALFGYDLLVVALLTALAALLVLPHRQDLADELRPTPAVPAPAEPDSTPDAEPLRFKIASEAWESEAIHRLNYRTFVEEIPQHAPNPERRLVDRFHAENRYVIALRGLRVVGMMAVRGRWPFSLDAKVSSLDRHLPAGGRPVEVRLLAVEPAFRRSVVFTALFACAARHCLDEGYDLAVISATTRQLKLYRHLGFTPFGPLVGTDVAPYQPMFLTIENLRRMAGKSAALSDLRGECPAPPPPELSFLTGPVRTTPAVDAAFAVPAISHRSPVFIAQIAAVRQRLCELTGASDVQILPGSGSLANAVVAAQLGLRDTPGLVLANGEFGERLVAEARRARLRFTTLSLPWGAAFDLAEIEARALRLPRDGWLWCVHHETSTGMSNPLDALKTIARRRHLRLCLDGISSVGSQPVDLRGVHLATATSGKGLGAYPGLALVFHDYAPQPEPDRLAGYLDLGHWAGHASVPHTHSSNLVGALAAALRENTPARLARIRDHSVWLRTALRNCGFAIVAPDDAASPAVVTIALSAPLTSAGLGDELGRRGFVLNFRSPHLLARNWIQIALFGDPPRPDLDRLLDTLLAARKTALIAASAAKAVPKSRAAMTPSHFLTHRLEPPRATLNFHKFSAHERPSSIDDRKIKTPAPHTEDSFARPCSTDPIWLRHARDRGLHPRSDFRRDYWSALRAQRTLAGAWHKIGRRSWAGLFLRLTYCTARHRRSLCRQTRRSLRW